jgi:hypothetical protein
MTFFFELRKALLRDYYECNELEELEWFNRNCDLQSAFGNDDELANARKRVNEIFQTKQKAKSPMKEDDANFAEKLQKKVNSLFKEGKIDLLAKTYGLLKINLPALERINAGGVNHPIHPPQSFLCPRRGNRGRHPDHPPDHPGKKDQKNRGDLPERRASGGGSSFSSLTSSSLFLLAEFSSLTCSLCNEIKLYEAPPWRSIAIHIAKYLYALGHLPKVSQPQ